ncbi:hypothetical protein T310_9128, partial [Rasamsonia emersonii CBS 393.64]
VLTYLVLCTLVYHYPINMSCMLCYAMPQFYYKFKVLRTTGSSTNFRFIRSGLTSTLFSGSKSMVYVYVIMNNDCGAFLLGRAQPASPYGKDK